MKRGEHLMTSDKYQENTLYYGDCLKWMSRWIENGHREFVDLIYLDPPFNSDANYNITFGTQSVNGKPAQVKAFTDTWSWTADAESNFRLIKNSSADPLHNVVTGMYSILGSSGMLAYLIYMGKRLLLMKELLKPKGSIYLHCDPTASHYLKLIMDAVFGSDKKGDSNFRNEIIWCYKENDTANRYFPRKHDSILFYTKGADYLFNLQRGEITEAQRKRYNHIIDGERYANMKGKMRKLEGGARYRDWWEIPIAQESERTGYPTQKPLALLERIIKASSNEGDIVLDPFCGCGTTIEVAHNLGRKWIGIDISAFAIEVVQKRRLHPHGVTAKVDGIPEDMESARKFAKADPFGFETWAIHQIIGLAPNDRQTGDRGIDGRGLISGMPDDNRLVLAQVKSGKFKLSELRDFIHVVNRDKAALGIFITLEPVTSTEARVEVAKEAMVKIKSREFSKINLWSIQDLYENRPMVMPEMLDPYATQKRQIGIQQGLDTSEDYSGADNA